MLQFLLILALLIGLPQGAWAVLACSDVTPFNDLTPTDPETIAYTTPAGSNQVLFVGVGSRGSATIDSATHAGNAMTAVTAEAFINPIHARIFYIVSPTSGTNNVVVQFSATALADSVVIWTCSGVDTTDPIRAFATATGTGTAVSATVATVNTGDVVVDMFATDVATTDPTVGTNQTSLNLGNDGAELGWGASKQAGADGGVMTWTTTLSQEWAQMALSIRQFSARSHIAPLVTQ